MNIYVGNLSYSVTESELKQLFQEFGQVDSVKVITDMQTGRPKGFAFVDMPDAVQAQEAINQLNGKTIQNRPIRVNPARDRAERPARSDRRPSHGGGQGGGFRPRNRF